MKKSIYKLLFAFLIFVGTSLHAQKIDPKAKTILDGVSKNYKSKKNVYFKFVYQTGNKKITKRETGIFYSTPTQHKLRIMGIEQIFDGKKIYNISHEDKEVTIAKADKNDIMFSPINYIDEYKNGYNVTLVGKKDVNGIKAELIKLTPVSNNGIKDVLIYVDTAKKQLVRVEQNSTNNDIAIITVSEYKENQTLNSNLFTFNKSLYKDFLITEL